MLRSRNEVCYGKRCNISCKAAAIESMTTLRYLEETFTDRQPADQVTKGCQWQVKRFVGTEAHQGIMWKTCSTSNLPFVKISWPDELGSDSWSVSREHGNLNITFSFAAKMSSSFHCDFSTSASRNSAPAQPRENFRLSLTILRKDWSINDSSELLKLNRSNCPESSTSGSSSTTTSGCIGSSSSFSASQSYILALCAAISAWIRSSSSASCIISPCFRTTSWTCSFPGL